MTVSLSLKDEAMETYIGQAAGCKRQPPYDHIQNELDKAANRPYLEACQLETPGFDHEERREPKRVNDPCVSLRSRPFSNYPPGTKNTMLAA